MFVKYIRNSSLSLAFLIAIFLFFIPTQSVFAVPPMPWIYSGTVEVAGEPIVNSVMEIDDALDGNGDPLDERTYGELVCVTYCIHAKIGTWTTASVAIKDGIYTALNVGPPDVTYNNKTIYFYIAGRTFPAVNIDKTPYDILADETETFSAAFLPSVTFNYRLTFAKLPDPTPTPTPTVTPTPVIAQPSVYSGPLIISGASNPPNNAVLIAKIGSYTSAPAVIDGESYKNLILNPSNITYEGMKIEFYLNGYKSLTTDIFYNGSFNLSFPLLFTAIPNATATPIPVTAVPIAVPVIIPTITPTPILIIKTIIVTPTPVTSTSTPIPSVTPLPTSTPVAPTPIVLVVTATPESDISTPVPLESGGCFAKHGDLSVQTGAANIFFLISPLLFIIFHRIYRKKIK